MIPFEVIVTAVSERADLFARTMESMLEKLDSRPTRLIVHEDVKPGSEPGAIRGWLECAKAAGVTDSALFVTDPAKGLGPAMHTVLHEARTPIVFYTQEDFDFVRPIPVQRALSLMEEHGLNHIRFNKRKTMPSKCYGTSKQWDKIEKQFGDQTLTISDHWYFQASLWRVAPILPAFDYLVKTTTADVWVPPQINQWMNEHCGGQGNRFCLDQETRHQRLKTYIWGGIGEPAFIRHTGDDRHSQPEVTSRQRA